MKEQIILTQNHMKQKKQLSQLMKQYDGFPEEPVLSAFENRALHTNKADFFASTKLTAGNAAVQLVVISATAL